MHLVGEAAAAPKSRLAQCSLAQGLEAPRSAPAATAASKEAAGGLRAAGQASGSREPRQPETLRTQHEKPRTASSPGYTGQDRQRSAADTL